MNSVWKRSPRGKAVRPYKSTQIFSATGGRVAEKIQWLGKFC